MDSIEGTERRNLLSRALLGTEPKYSSSEVIEYADIEPDLAHRLWRAMGLAETGDDKAYGDADVGALKTVADSIRLGVFDDDVLLRLTRALGTTMARLADWQVSTLATEVEQQVADGKFPGRMEAAYAMAKTVTPAFDGLLLYVWRRHLAASVLRLEAHGADDEELLSTEQTVGFADLVRFTALTNRINDEALGELVEEFETIATEVITSTGSRAVKTLGDAVLFVSPTPITAVETSLQIIESFSKSQKLPDVRIGLATGNVINRLGDVFGPPVNLASRLTAVARRNRVIVDKVTASRLGDGYETRVLPARPLSGFGEVEPVTVRRPWSYQG